MAKVLTDFGQVIGQENIVRWFQSCIKRDKMPQVVMLAGPAGIGKTSIAKLAACEIACIPKPSILDEVKHTVIEEYKSSDCVKVYNMSNLRSQEEVGKVKADLQIGLSSTGRKCIIMDEAHGMSQEAQDSLLTSFEALPLGVYIFICTTNLECFRDAFLSRALLRRLTNLSSSDMRKLLQKHIKEQELRFELSTDMVISLISNYTGREPRRALNLIESFEQGSNVSVSDLDSFFSVFEGKQMVSLIQYMYKEEILMGLNFINELEIGTTLQESLLEILRIAQGARPTILDKETTLFLRELVEINGIDRLIKFVIKCTNVQRLTRNRLCSAFLQCAFEEKGKIPVKSSSENVRVQDLGLMEDLLEQTDLTKNIPKAGTSMTLMKLLENSETIE